MQISEKRMKYLEDLSYRVFHHMVDSMEEHEAYVNINSREDDESTLLNNLIWQRFREDGIYDLDITITK